MLLQLFFPQSSTHFSQKESSKAFENSHDFANPLYFCLEYRKVKTVTGMMPCFESNFKATLCNPGTKADIFVSVMKIIIPARWHHERSNKRTWKRSLWSSLNSVDHFWHLTLDTSFMPVAWDEFTKADWHRVKLILFFITQSDTDLSWTNVA